MNLTPVAQEIERQHVPQNGFFSRAKQRHTLLDKTCIDSNGLNSVLLKRDSVTQNWLINLTQDNTSNPIHLHGTSEQALLDWFVLLRFLAWTALCAAAAFNVVIALVASQTMASILFNVTFLGLCSIVISTAINAIECIEKFAFCFPSIAANKEQLNNEAINVPSKPLSNPQLSLFEKSLESLFWVAAMATTATAGIVGISVHFWAGFHCMTILTLLGASSTLVSEASSLVNSIPHDIDFSYGHSIPSALATEYSSPDDDMPRMAPI